MSRALACPRVPSRDLARSRSVGRACVRQVREGYPRLGGGCGPSGALRTTRLASALVRWAVGVCVGELTRRREASLTAVARELLRCRANLPPVRATL